MNPASYAATLINWFGSVVFILVVVLGAASPAQAQLSGVPQPVDGLITSTRAPITENFPTATYANPCDTSSLPNCTTAGATTNLTFGSQADGELVLNAVNVGGVIYEPATDLLPPSGLVPRIVFRRVGAPERGQLFYQYSTVGADVGAANFLNLLPRQALDIESAMLSPVINVGIDNVFNNSLPDPGSEQNTQNNIERIDYLTTGPAPGFAGLDISTINRATAGFLILERGGNDFFRIAAITAVDGSGAPSAYGPLITVPNTAWGNSGSPAITTAVLRRDDLVNPPAPGQPRFNPSHLVPAQSVQGIYFPLNSLVPDSVTTIFGYSLFANDVVGPDLVNFAAFPTNTTGANNQGGLDLVAGGFGLVRQQGSGILSLVKRITSLTASGNVINFTQVSGTETGFTQLANVGLGQGVTTVTQPQVQSGDAVEYTIYFVNISTAPVTGVSLCDQIPLGTTFLPNSFGSGRGIRAIAPSNPPPPPFQEVNYTNTAGDDPGTFFPANATLPEVCGTQNRRNGAVVVNIGTVEANQVGFVRFRATVN